MRVTLPIYPATHDFSQVMLVSRGQMAMIPQDDMFVVDVAWRFENYSDVSWVPKDVTFPLPEGFEALTVKEVAASGNFETDGDAGAKLVGTFPPGKHDLMFRFHLPTDGMASRTFDFPSGLNVAWMRVILESSPSMALKVEGLPAPEDSRNRDGQRMLVIVKDFLADQERPPQRFRVSITGIPTPPAGRLVAVSMAALIALGGLAFGLRRHTTVSARSQLSKEDRERAGELLLSELIELEQAFQQGGIGRRMYDRTRRQLLEAFARLGPDVDSTAA
jgi:hypothetical protein